MRPGRRRAGPALLLCAGALVTGCGSDSTDDPAAGGAPPVAASAGAAAGFPERRQPQVTPPRGPAPRRLVVKEPIAGTGAKAKPGDEVRVHYVTVDYEKGREISASWDPEDPFAFIVGAGEVVDGWDLGIEGMRAGGRRELVVPSRLAYGSGGATISGPKGDTLIPPNTTLVSVIDLLAVN